MSQYYNPKRSRNLYQPQTAGEGQPFALSRSKLELFLNCPRCFYLDCRLGLSRPPGFPFNLNSAVDILLKKEFDFHRAAGTVHPLVAHYGLKLKPLQHDSMNVWRENFQGVHYHHQATNLIITGAVDDLWQDDEGLVYVVDYKATSKEEKIEALTADWQDSYKRQMEIYQWLLRRQGLPVSNRGYFVYANGRRDLAAFDGRLEFDVTLIDYDGQDDWVEPVIFRAHQCLNSQTIPAANPDCDYCAYFASRTKTETL